VSTVRDDARRTLEKKRQAVTRAAEALARAKDELARAVDDLVELVSEVAIASGPSPSPASAKQKYFRYRRKVIGGMLSAGKSEDEIASALGVPVELVRADSTFRGSTTKALTPEETKSGGRPEDKAGVGDGSLEILARPLRFPPESREPGWKRKRVMELYLEGKARADIADELDMSRESVGSHIMALREQGLLPPVEMALREQGLLPPVESGPAPEPCPAVDEDVATDLEYEGDSIEDLRTEVIRQQAGQRSKAAQLATTTSLGHEHSVLVDRMGDGLASAVGSDHVHNVYRFVVGRANGHTHDLRVPSPVTPIDGKQ